MKNEAWLVTFIIVFIMGTVGLGNGAFSHVWSCQSAYLNFRKPIHYILIPHTVGFYIGRALTFDYGEERYTNCSTIFNQTLEGPR